MFFQAVYLGHFLSFYTMQLEPPKFCVFAGSCLRKRIKVLLFCSRLLDEEKAFSF